MVTWENYEEYMCLHTDGELSETETRELYRFVEQHPELQDELKAFSAARLVPDTSIVFRDKEMLLKPEGRVIALGNWKTYSAAAGLLILLATGLAQWTDRGRSETADQVAVTASEKEPAAPLTTPVTRNELTEPAENKEAAPVRMVEAIAAADEKKPEAAVLELQPLAPATPVIQGGAITAPEAAHLAVTVPAIDHNITLEAPAEEKEFLAWLPVEEEKKMGLKTLTSSVSSRIEQAKIFKENIKETTFALKLGRKELVINF